MRAPLFVICAQAFLRAESGQQRYIPGEDGTYAQNYQDTWIQAVAQRNGWTSGFYLDLGAFHGTMCSNSALLDLKHGWKGVCVEPQPKKFFKDRHCVVAARALSDRGGQKVNFYGYGQDKHVARESDVTGRSGSVETMTVAELLNCVNGTAADCNGVRGQLNVPKFIHFVSMDIEGSEAKVLRTWPWSVVDVGVWIIEQTPDASRPPAERQEVLKLLEAKGYMQAPVKNPGVDVYFIKPGLWDPSLAAKKWRVHPPGSSGC
jgi:hypothetical protein